MRFRFVAAIGLLLSQAPAQASDWAGPYLGLAVGGKWTSTDWTARSFGLAGGGNLGPDNSKNDRFSPVSVRLGAFGGYNWHAGAFVYGLEIDAAWTDGTDTHRGIPGCKIICFVGFPGPGATSSSVRALWDAGLRARLGYLLTPETLVYGSGGLAVQALTSTATCQTTLVDPVCTLTVPRRTRSETNHFVLTGWTLGAGVERRITSSWLVRGEYRYAHFGSLGSTFFSGAPIDVVRYRLQTGTHIATLGIAFKL